MNIWRQLHGTPCVSLNICQGLICQLLSYVYNDDDQRVFIFSSAIQVYDLSYITCKDFTVVLHV